MEKVLEVVRVIVEILAVVMLETKTPVPDLLTVCGIMEIVTVN